MRGGNLGFTQLGRIEYAKSGGRINTDSIDNSAGVDCSDHEVNIKIAFSEALASKKITITERNKLLNKMTDDVASLVLVDNFKQYQIISMEQQDTKSKINYHDWLIRHLEFRGELNREIENLPLAEDIASRASEGLGLTRPEIAVLVAYAKNSIYSMLLEHDFTKDPYLKKYLYAYFPTEFVEKHSKLIEEHKLKNEILATIVTNDIVNILGSSFFHQTLEDNSFKSYDFAMAFIAVRDILDIESHWKNVENLLGKVPNNLRITLFKELQSVLKRNMVWILRHHGNTGDVAKIVDRYKEGVSVLVQNADAVMTHLMECEYEYHFESYSQIKECKDIARSILNLRMMVHAFDIIEIAEKTHTTIEEAAINFFKLGEKMSLDWMVAQIKRFIPKQYFQTVALKAMLNEIEDIQTQLTINQISTSKESEKKTKSYSSCIVNTDKMSKYNVFIAELKATDTSEALVAMLTIALKRVKEFL